MNGSVAVLFQLLFYSWVTDVGGLEILDVGEREVAEPDEVHRPVARTHGRYVDAEFKADWIQRRMFRRIPQFYPQRPRAIDQVSRHAYAAHTHTHTHKER